MIENDDNELAQKVLTNPEYPGWGYMVAQGAISVWERWEKEITNLVMHSYGHPMFGSYDIWFYEGLAGIRFNDCCRGTSEFVLQPAFNTNISFVNCSINTINGKVESNWKREGDLIKYEFTVPSNTTALLKINGKINTLPKGIVQTDTGYKCCSGRYCIVIG